MSNQAEDEQADDERELTAGVVGPFERLVHGADGLPYIEFDSQAHEVWLAKWLEPCPDGSPQRVREALGFRERSVGELELRVAIGGGDEYGVCTVIVDECDEEVFVRVLICYDEEEEWVPPAKRTYTDCPVRVWLDRPLGDRAVVDVDSDQELALFFPAYRDNVPDPRHGYHPANRRRRT